MEKLNFGIVNLGCDKNRVDGEIILNKASRQFNIVSDARLADIILINTCGFIEASKQESINTILQMAQYKKEYRCKVLIATGCLTQRYKKEILELIPELDIILGVNDYDKLIASINDFIKNKNKICFCNYSNEIINEGERILTTPSYTAYLRIAEGCSNYCTYCAIPKIRGKYRSRKFDNIINEAKTLAENGAKEIILIAQDITRYGIDLYNKKRLPELIREISKIESIKWIRLLYCYPEEITDELIQEIKVNDKVCKYIDIPIQHISDTVLKRMGRRGTKEDIRNVINKLRNNIPNICIRTTLIVGFPGETNEEFEEVIDFIKEMKFSKLGAFAYSQEENTPAALMTNQIEEDIKKERERQVMSIQQNISYEINKSKIGNIYDVIVEDFTGEVYEGRNYENSPEIDGAIFFKYDKILNMGDIIKVKITEANEYDLIGVVCNESC